MLKEDDLLKLGFKRISHFTIGSSLIFDLNRNRNLSFSNIGTPNEVLFLCQNDEQDKRLITDLICLHNYDFDGYMTLKRIKKLIKILMNNR